MKLSVLLMLCAGCGAVALSQYKAQLKYCDDHSHSAAEDDACKAKVRASWDEAGAPKAVVLIDGGVE